MSLCEAGCAICLKEVGLQALSGQQGRGNFPRTLQPSQPATWETRAVGVALSLVTEKSGRDPWPSYIPSFLVYRTSLSLRPPPIPFLIRNQSSTMHQEHRGKRHSLQCLLPYREWASWHRPFSGLGCPKRELFSSCHPALQG